VEPKIRKSLSTNHDALRKKLVDDEFWESMRYARNVLKPVCNAIKLVEGDTADFSTFLIALETLKEGLHTAANVVDRQWINDAWEYRKEFLYSPAMSLAFELNPLCRVTPGKSDAFRAEHRKKGLDFLRVIVPDVAVRELVTNEYLQYVARVGPFAPEFWTSIESETVDAITWWKVMEDFGAKRLAPIAIRLLSVPISSAAAERNWSLYGFIHNQRRNRLSNDRAQKLVFVCSALRTRRAIGPAGECKADATRILTVESGSESDGEDPDARLAEDGSESDGEDRGERRAEDGSEGDAADFDESNAEDGSECDAESKADDGSEGDAEDCPEVSNPK
jgi:hypothetical protein